MSGHTPWSEVKRKRAHEFHGVFYVTDDKVNDVLHAIADVVCPADGTVCSKPLHPEDEDVEGIPHDDE